MPLYDPGVEQRGARKLGNPAIPWRGHSFDNVRELTAKSEALLPPFSFSWIDIGKHLLQMMLYVAQVISDNELQRCGQRISDITYIGKRVRTYVGDNMAKMNIIAIPKPDNILPRFHMILLRAYPMKLRIRERPDVWNLLHPYKSLMIVGC